jgi:hypothetical protein
MAKRPDGFVNVDLEVGARTRAALAPLIEELEQYELWRGRIGRLYRAHYEVHLCPGANATIHKLAAMIEALHGPARRAWNAAPFRDFNIGVELEPGVRNIELALDDETVRRVIALGGRIVFTAYQISAMQPLPRRPNKPSAS